MLKNNFFPEGKGSFPQTWHKKAFFGGAQTYGYFFNEKLSANTLTTYFTFLFQHLEAEDDPSPWIGEQLENTGTWFPKKMRPFLKWSKFS